MEDRVINLSVIEIKFLDGWSKGDELHSIQGTGWRLPTESEMEYISNLYIDYGVVGKDGWYWTDTGVIYELDTKSHFKPLFNENESAGVILVKDF